MTVAELVVVQLCGAAGRQLSSSVWDQETEIHLWSWCVQSLRTGRGSANIPAEAADIWFFSQQPNTTCPLLVSQTRPLLLGPGDGGREKEGWSVTGWLGRQVTSAGSPIQPGLVQSREEKALHANTSLPIWAARQGQEDRTSSFSTWRTFSGTKMFGYSGVCVSWPLFCGDSGWTYSLMRRNGRARFLHNIRYCCTARQGLAKIDR